MPGRANVADRFRGRLTWSRGSKRRPCKRGSEAGWTLLECLLAVAIMALVFAAAAPLLQKAAACYSAADPRLGLVNEARTALAALTRDFREARSVVEVTQSDRADSEVRFASDAGDTIFFGLATAENPYRIQYGRPGAVGTLAFNCQSLWITCYGADGTVLPMPGSDRTAIRSVGATVTVYDPAGRADPMTFATRASLRRSLPNVVINEIMYRPTGAILGAKGENQWVELYNPTAKAVDVAGWRLWTKDQGTPNTLVADPLYSTGTGVIPAGGYAVITDTDSELYKEKLNNGDFEKGSMSDWTSTGGWTVAAGGAVSGNYVAQCTSSSWNTISQDFKIESAATKARFRVWARKGSSTGKSQLIIQITNRGSTVLATIYNGECTTVWTPYEADLTPYINMDARLEISATRGSSGATVYVDAAVIHWSRNPNLPLDALHLWVNSSTIGKNLEDAQVFLAQGGCLRDVVVFDTTWGGGDNSTLSRRDAFAPSSEEATWQPGPFAGTPAAVNP